MHVNHSERANTVVIHEKKGLFMHRLSLQGDICAAETTIPSHNKSLFIFWSCSDVLIGAPEKLCHTIMCSGEVILSD